MIFQVRVRLAFIVAARAALADRPVIARRLRCSTSIRDRPLGSWNPAAPDRQCDRRQASRSVDHRSSGQHRHNRIRSTSRVFETAGTRLGGDPSASPAKLRRPPECAQGCSENFRRIWFMVSIRLRNVASVFNAVGCCGSAGRDWEDAGSAAPKRTRVAWRLRHTAPTATDQKLRTTRPIRCSRGCPSLSIRPWRRDPPGAPCPNPRPLQYRPAVSFAEASFMALRNASSRPCSGRRSRLPRFRMGLTPIPFFPVGNEIVCQGLARGTSRFVGRCVREAEVLTSRPPVPYSVRKKPGPALHPVAPGFCLNPTAHEVSPPPVRSVISRSETAWRRSWRHRPPREFRPSFFRAPPAAESYMLAFRL